MFLNETKKKYMFYLFAPIYSIFFSLCVCVYDGSEYKKRNSDFIHKFLCVDVEDKRMAL